MWMIPSSDRVPHTSFENLSLEMIRSPRLSSGSLYILISNTSITMWTKLESNSALRNKNKQWYNDYPLIGHVGTYNDDLDTVWFSSFSTFVNKVYISSESGSVTDPLSFSVWRDLKIRKDKKKYIEGGITTTKAWVITKNCSILYRSFST